MPARHALLGLIALKPRTGYDLHKRIDRFFPLLEPISLRRIYPMLKRMTDDGLITFEVEPQVGKPDRKVYHLTDAGERELLEWLRQPAEEAHSTFIGPLMLRFFLYGLLDKETLLARLRDIVKARRALFREAAGASLSPPPSDRDFVDPDAVMRVWRLMADYGHSEEKLQVEWLEHCIETVEDEW